MVGRIRNIIKISLISLRVQVRHIKVIYVNTRKFFTSIGAYNTMYKVSKCRSLKILCNLSIVIEIRMKKHD